MAEIERSDSAQHRLPPITQPGDTRSSSHSKLDRLARQISSRNVGGSQMGAGLERWGEELGEKSSKTLLKTVAALSRISLKAKGELGQSCNLGKNVKLKSLESTVLKGESLGNEGKEEGMRGDTVRVSIHM
mgnify:CR=1 FL=1